jgi:hypothetical protein
MIDSKEIEKAMDAVDRVIFNHGKQWQMESAYNEYLARQQRLEAMPDGFAKSLMMLWCCGLSLIRRLKVISFSVVTAPRKAKASKAKTVYIKGIEPDSVYSGAALIDAINKELHSRPRQLIKDQKS